jgi:hypothetical protein
MLMMVSVTDGWRGFGGESISNLFHCSVTQKEEILREMKRYGFLKLPLLA